MAKRQPLEAGFELVQRIQVGRGWGEKGELAGEAHMSHTGRGDTYKLDQMVDEGIDGMEVTLNTYNMSALLRCIVLQQSTHLVSSSRKFPVAFWTIRRGPPCLILYY